MSMLNFDATQIPPQQAFEPLPAGWYNMHIIESETKPTKDQQGAYLQLTFKVLDGKFVNRQVIARLNIRNSNPTAQEIAWGQLSAICHAVGVVQVQDSQQLHGRPLQVRVSVKAASGDYDANNEVKGFKAIEGGAPAAAAGMTGSAPSWAGQQSAPQPPQPAGAAPQPVQQPIQQPQAQQPQTAPAQDGGIPQWAMPSQQ